MHNIKNMSLNKKITIFFICVMLVTNFTNLVITYKSAGETITEKSTWLAESQVQAMKNSLLRNLNDIKDLARIIRFDYRIEDYFMQDGNNLNSKEILATDNAYKSIRYLSDVKRYIDYIGLIKYSKNQVVYVGKPWTNNNFREKMLDNYYDDSNQKFQSLKMGINNDIFDNNEYVINFFEPVFDSYNLNRELGFIVIGIKESKLQEFYNDYESNLSFKLHLVNGQSKIISDENNDMINTDYKYYSYINNKKGHTKVYNNMIIYDYIPGWNIYVVGNIEISDLVFDSRKTMIIIIIAIILVTILLGGISFGLINQLYCPIDDIVDKMSRVSEGNLDVKMENRYSGEDFKKMTDGFNSMINKINQLLNKVKEEQNQIRKIELNALQSQIKPHFLYNTLECIHWRALSDGNKDVSNMVKSLANYYRICLSKGKDIIPLSQEIEHIKNYLIIQNMRYGDIVQSEFLIAEECKEIMIPKMTLQPLVENSIYHGMKVKENYKGKIIIKGEIKNYYALISVIDTGVGMNESDIQSINKSMNISEESNGYGIKNVSKRIQIIFGKEYYLHYLRNSYGGVTVEIKLPTKI